jgi:hypothetical protein
MLNTQKSTNLIVFNPLEIARKKSEQEQLKKMNIAAELLITKNVGIYYVDIMNGIDTDLYASSKSLLDWLNDKDHTRKETRIQRDGLITLYKQDCPEDFIDGKWQAYNLPNYIYYIGTALIDKKYTKTVANKYKRSFANEEWFMKLVAVAGIKLLEQQMELDSLHSVTALQVLKTNKTTRQFLEKANRAIGRSTKNHDANFMKNELKDIVDSFLRQAQGSIQKEILAFSNERHVLEEFENEYSLALENARIKLLV